MLGSFSTPFSRVVQAAAVARKEGRAFSATDVAPGLVEPQLHVIAISQPALKDETKAATVVAVKLAVRGGNAPPIEPLKTVALTDDYQKLTGVKLDRSGVVALFPLAALAPNAEIHVTFKSRERHHHQRCVRSASSPLTSLEYGTLEESTSSDRGARPLPPACYSVLEVHLCRPPEPT